jgi:hypothetical protein
LSAAFIAVRERAASPAPDSTDQLCDIESMRHSTLSADPQRRAVIEVRAPIPFAVPTVQVEIAAQLRLRLVASLRERGIAPCACELGELPQDRAKEEPQPHAFARALDADEVHAVVPVARAHERQATRPEAQAMDDRTHAMLVEARRLARAARQVVVRIVPRD